jgi:hypothetical protein
MATKAFEPIGLSLSGTSDEGTDYADFFAEITDIDLEIDTDEIDVSHFNSENYKDFIAAKLKDPGQISGTINFDPAVAPPIGQDVSTVTINFPDADSTAWSADCFLKTYGFSGSVGEQMTSSFTLRLTGAINFNV